eukprot:TRINITY_DN4280_c0_g1_i4.p1 TRINITY_DN4280_c0_g1~~TRINITY_DN4280_c0_g1_i4.p1  ORF type:complete len:172 (+),score=23.27 TRINITY_DN4280_c0_g1_i4:91-606(+)
MCIRDSYRMKCDGITKRSEIAGKFDKNSNFFDDYQEKLKSMFLTSHLKSLTFYYNKSFILGIETAYWNPAETPPEFSYKHVIDGHSTENKEVISSVIVLEYGELLEEMFAAIKDGTFTWIHLKTSRGRKSNIGFFGGSPISNFIPVGLCSIRGIGGSMNNKGVQSLYLYYS